MDQGSNVVGSALDVDVEFSVAFSIRLYDPDGAAWMDLDRRDKVKPSIRTIQNTALKTEAAFSGWNYCQSYSGWPSVDWESRTMIAEHWFDVELKSTRVKPRWIFSIIDEWYVTLECKWMVSWEEVPSLLVLFLDSDSSAGTQTVLVVESYHVMPCRTMPTECLPCGKISTVGGMWCC